MKTTTPLKSFTVLSLSLMLFGCGGGSGSSNGAPTPSTVNPTPSPAPNPVPSPTPNPTPAPTPLTVTSASPDSGMNDGPSTVTIRGSGFQQASTVTLDTATPSPLSFTIVSDSEITATVPQGLTPGAFDLTVNGQSGPPWTVRNMLDPNQPGAFTVAFLDTTIPGASGDSPSARIHYPGTSSGLNGAPDPLGAPYPVIVYNHGFKPPIFAAGIDFRANDFIAERLASFGYIVICVDLAPNNVLFGSGANAQDNSQRDADDARAALDYFQVSNSDPQHPLRGLIDWDNAAIAGHSRGGDAAILAASTEIAALGSGSRIKTIAVFGPPSSGITTGAFQSIPSLFIGATEDNIAPFSDQLLLYGFAGPGSMLFEIVGGNHSQYKDSADVLMSDGTATMSLSEQHAICQQTLVSWFQTHIRGKTAAFADYLYNGSIIQNDPRVQSLVSK